MASKGFYEPGDVLYRGKCFARAMPRSTWDQACANCGKRIFSPRPCSKCNLMKYCNEVCRKKDLEYHKLECPHLHKLPTEIDDPFLQLTGNCILKLKGKDWSKVVDVVMDKEFSFKDIKITKPEWEIQPYHPLYSAYFEQKVKHYVGEENFPKKEEFLDIVGRLHITQFETKLFESMKFFIGTSVFKRSCVPNCTFISFNARDPGFCSIRASKRICKQSDVATISFCPMLEPISHLKHEESKKLYADEESFCSDCVQEYGSSPLTKILDIPKSFPVIQDSAYLLRMVSIAEDLRCPLHPLVLQKICFLLDLQKGVLADTHLLRIRMKAMKCHYSQGDGPQYVRDLQELVEWVKQAWGENFEELVPLYVKLVHATRNLGDITAARDYSLKIQQLERMFNFQGMHQGVPPQSFPTMAEFVSLFSNIQHHVYNNF